MLSQDYYYENGGAMKTPLLPSQFGLWRAEIGKFKLE